MKNFLAFFTAVILLLFATVVCGATETASTSELVMEERTEAIAEPEEASAVDLAEIIEDVEQGNLTVDAAIDKLSEKSGMTKEQAEDIINDVLALGDKYLGEYKWWEDTSVKIDENRRTLVLIILAIASVSSIVLGAVVLYFEGKKINRIEYGTGKVVGDSAKMNKAISQTIVTLNKQVVEVLDDFKIIKQWLEEKDKKISELEIHNSELESGMLDVEMYILQMLKLIYSRTNLTLTDKSLLDLWQAKAESDLKGKMSPEGIKKHEEMIAMLKESGDSDAG